MFVWNALHIYYYYITWLIHKLPRKHSNVEIVPAILIPRRVPRRPRFPQSLTEHLGLLLSDYYTHNIHLNMQFIFVYILLGLLNILYILDVSTLCTRLYLYYTQHNGQNGHRVQWANQINGIPVINIIVLFSYLIGLNSGRLADIAFEICPIKHFLHTPVVYELFAWIYISMVLRDKTHHFPKIEYETI